MFSTMRYNKGLDALTSVENLHNTQRIPSLVSSNRHLACKACRSGKARCSGQDTGCDRCREKGLDCIYTVKSKGRAQNRTSSCSKKSRDSSQAPQPRRHERQTSSNESSDGLQDDHHSAPSEASVGAIDPSLLAQSDAFDASMMDWSADSQSFEQDSDLQDAIAELFSSDARLSPFMEHHITPAFATGYEPPLMPEKMITPQFRRQSAPSVNVSDVSSSSSDPHRMCNPPFGTVPTSPRRQNQQLHIEPSCSRSFNFSSSTRTSPPLQDFISSNLLDLSPRHMGTQIASTGIPPTPSIPRTASSPHLLAGTTSSSTAQQQQCNCIMTATKVLEAVSTDLDSASLLAPDALLNSHRSKLRDCQSVLECLTCRSSSTIILLLALIAEKLVAASRRLPSCINHWQSMSLGSYLMDSPEECQAIIKQLVIRQLNSLRSLLKTLLLLTCSTGCEMHQKKVRTSYDSFQEFCLDMDLSES